MTLVAGLIDSDFHGEVIDADHPSYDEARSLFLGGFDRRPAVVLRPHDAQDVAAAIRSAVAADLPLAVKGGGHQGAGLSVCDDGVVVDLSSLDGLDIDLEDHTAWAGAGLTAGDYTRAMGEHGLATGFGDTGTVGIGGLTLGGGVGLLSRKFGLTVDDLLAAEVVTADGSILEVDEDNHPDLFWAIRGGGGNFGVVTRFRFRLHELPEVYGGILVLPATAEVVAGFVDLASAAPDELSTILNVMVAPPLPFLPEHLHGTTIAMALVCYAGPAADGERVLAPFRALAEPLADMVTAIPYSGIFAPEDPDFHPTAMTRTSYTDGIDLDLAATIVERVRSYDAPLRVCQIRVLGGAIARVPDDATAYAHRERPIMVNVTVLYETPETRPARQAWLEELSALVNPAEGAAYANFLADDAPDRIRAAYPGATYDRLVAAKKTWDPGNVFRLNVNIEPDGNQ